jgi:hypothetical protein
MISEHTEAVLTEDIPDAGLRASDIGTVVMVHGQGTAYEVEFMTLTGKTVAVLTLTADQIRPAIGDEIAHARQVA